jgi:ubiquinone/menaquinone biosynthesis C-methylase UbiE
MADESVLEAMRSDWNERAREDANYYVAFGRKQQPEDEFFATGEDQVRAFETELKRRPARFWRDAVALEIGCGPGRLLRPLSRHFREIHGTDVSDEMIRRAEANLRGVDNVRLHHAAESNLSQFPEAQVDFIYSYAVFQHIPSKEVIFGYFDEAFRVLRPGGFFVFQINGLPDRGHETTTWNGVRVGAEEIVAFARRTGMLLLQLNDKETQYVWVTLQKPVTQSPDPPPLAQLIRIRNAYTGEPVVPATGRFGAASIWMENLPDDADLLNMSATVNGVPAYGCYVSPPVNRLRHFNIILPRGTRTGLVPIGVFWRGNALFPPAWVRVIPPGARVPRVCSLTDGINLLSPNRIESGIAKLVMEEVAEPERLRVKVSGEPAVCGAFCVNPLHERYEFDFQVPAHVPDGPAMVEIALGERRFAPVRVDIANAASRLQA